MLPDDPEQNLNQRELHTDWSNAIPGNVDVMLWTFFLDSNVPMTTAI